MNATRTALYTSLVDQPKQLWRRQWQRRGRARLSLAVQQMLGHALYRETPQWDPALAMRHRGKQTSPVAAACWRPRYWARLAAVAANNDVKRSSSDSNSVLGVKAVIKVYSMRTAIVIC